MMVDLRTSYLGLRLRNPLIASASPLTGNLKSLRALEDYGAAAVVLPSLFEEDILQDRHALELALDAGAGVSEVCGGYFPGREKFGGAVEHYLALIDRARSALDIPVIASLNGTTDFGWTELAARLAAAGASAIELNLYDLPLDLVQSGVEVEEATISLVKRVRTALDVPLAVKLGPYYSAFGQMAQALADAGADGLVLFNRLYHPDVDLLRLCAVHNLELSRRHEMRLPMMWLTALQGQIPVSLAASTGVESAVDVVRYLLAGADAVMSTSALLRHGPKYMTSLLSGLEEWLESRGFDNINAVRGLLATHGDTCTRLQERDAYRASLHYSQPTAR
ncbi:MAG TPA: dihydroorotate dehydrogenase-like protein [Woeseiaceae bacterium]|nr:dihydroorotate dehydrogenase-like protein [Woeseiaceae bacterium]